MKILEFCRHAAAVMYTVCIVCAGGQQRRGDCVGVCGNLAHLKKAACTQHVLLLFWIWLDLVDCIRTLLSPFFVWQMHYLLSCGVSKVQEWISLKSLLNYLPKCTSFFLSFSPFVMWDFVVKYANTKFSPHYWLLQLRLILVKKNSFFVVFFCCQSHSNIEINPTFNCIIV